VSPDDVFNDHREELARASVITGTTNTTGATNSSPAHNTANTGPADITPKASSVGSANNMGLNAPTATTLSQQQVNSSLPLLRELRKDMTVSFTNFRSRIAEQGTICPRIETVVCDTDDFQLATLEIERIERAGAVGASGQAGTGSANVGRKISTTNTKDGAEIQTGGAETGNEPEPESKAASKTSFKSASSETSNFKKSSEEEEVVNQKKNFQTVNNYEADAYHEADAYASASGSASASAAGSPQSMAPNDNANAAPEDDGGMLLRIVKCENGGYEVKGGFGGSMSGLHGSMTSGSYGDLHQRISLAGSESDLQNLNSSLLISKTASLGAQSNNNANFANNNNNSMNSNRRGFQNWGELRAAILHGLLMPYKPAAIMRYSRSVFSNGGLAMVYDERLRFDGCAIGTNR
jgi:hypothetical protein